MTDAEAIDIYTDGACKGNPGAGGWGVLLKSGPHTREIYGGEPCTTNNRMELIAVIRALEALRRPARVRIHTDSQYVQKGISAWIHNWKRRGWQNGGQKTREEYRSVAAPGRACGESRDRVDLGERPFRPSGE